MNRKDKRQVTKFKDQVKILDDSLSTPDKSRTKCVKTLFLCVTRKSNPHKVPEVKLQLEQDPEWRRHQVQVMKALSKIVRLMMITEGTTPTTFHEMKWSELIELFISCRLFDVVNLLLRLKVRQSVTEDDASISLGDSWESVHFHSLEITSNIIFSSHTEKITTPFFDEVIKHRSFLDVVVGFAMDTSRPIMTCHALHILAYCCENCVSLNKKLGNNKDLFVRLCEYVKKNFAPKLMLDWFKGGVEQYELDMMGDRPEGLISRYFKEAFKENFMEEMTKDEQRQCVMLYAHCMHLFSLKLMAFLAVADDNARNVVLKDPTLLEPLIYRLEAPITSKFALAALNETLFTLTGLCINEAICHKLISTHNLIQPLERGVFHGTYDLVKNFFYLALQIIFHEGMIQSNFGAVESITRSATLHMYSPAHQLCLYMLTYLTYIVETDGVHHMIKYFGPHHIHYYPLYYFNKGENIEMTVTDILECYKTHAESAYRLADVQFQQRMRTSDGLHQGKAESLKEEGNKAFQDKNYKEAISKYTEALIICPPLREVQQQKCWYDLPITLYCNRAQCYLFLDQYQQAIKDCDEAIARCIGVADPTNKLGSVKDNTLMRKALFRRSKGLFVVKEYYRALCDITLCVMGDDTADYFISHRDKVLIQYRHMHGLEPIPSCDMCGLGIGKKLKRCARCTGLYCSRDCQLKAWEKFHKINCQEFVKTGTDSSDSN